MLFILFLAMPLIEIACFILVGQAIGLWPTLLCVLLAAVIGSLVLRMQGLSLLREIRTTVGQGQVPARALADAMMVALAGLLLLMPGFFSDLVALLLLIPAVRSAIYAYLKSRVTVVATSSTVHGATQKRVDEGTIELSDDEWRPR